MWLAKLPCANPRAHRRSPTLPNHTLSQALPFIIPSALSLYTCSLALPPCALKLTEQYLEVAVRLYGTRFEHERCASPASKICAVETANAQIVNEEERRGKHAR